MDEELNTVENEYINSKCPNCGSELHFLPGSNKVKCISCDSEFEIKSLGKGKLDSEETDYKTTIAKVRSQSVETAVQRTIHCQDCGGLINLNEKTIATTCPFCGSHRVVEEKKQEEIIKINGVVPFALKEQDVYSSFKLWIKKRKMAPLKFQNGKMRPTFSGLYIPFYTFDSNTFSKYTALRGDYYYTTRTVHSKNGTRTVRERHTRWTPVAGKVNMNFDDVVVRGTSNVLDKYIDQIKVFDFTQMQKYQEQYLLGYYGERPSVGLDAGFDNAKSIMMDRISKECISKIGGDTYSELKVQTNYENVTFKQIMAPIYNGTYEYQGKTYQFVCNGQNGACSGKSPVSIVKVSILVLIALALIGLFIWLAVYDYYNSDSVVNLWKILMN